MTECEFASFVSVCSVPLCELLRKTDIKDPNTCIKITVFDVCRSVHHNIIHIENPTRCHNASKLYFRFIWSSTCFGRHTAHHQEPKTALAASGFACVEGCWTCSCWTLSGSVSSFRLLMMGGVSPETCWASYKYEIKFWYTVASCWIFFVNYPLHTLFSNNPRMSYKPTHKVMLLYNGIVFTIYVFRHRR